MLESDQIKEKLIKAGGIELKVPKSVGLWAVRMPCKEVVVRPSWLAMLGSYILRFSTFGAYGKSVLRKPRSKWVIHTYIMQTESDILCTTKEVNPDGSEIKGELLFGMPLDTAGIPAGK